MIGNGMSTFVRLCGPFRWLVKSQVVFVYRDIVHTMTRSHVSNQDIKVDSYELLTIPSSLVTSTC